LLVVKLGIRWNQANYASVESHSKYLESPFDPGSEQNFNTKKFKDCSEILIKTLQDGNVESPEQVLSWKHWGFTTNTKLDWPIDWQHN